MSALLTITAAARTAQEAQEKARLWARGEPGIRLRKITRVRPNADDLPGHWDVEIAYVRVEPGLGL